MLRGGCRGHAASATLVRLAAPGQGRGCRHGEAQRERGAAPLASTPYLSREAGGLAVELFPRAWRAVGSMVSSGT